MVKNRISQVLLDSELCAIEKEKLCAPEFAKKNRTKKLHAVWHSGTETKKRPAAAGAEQQHYLQIAQCECQINW